MSNTEGWVQSLGLAKETMTGTVGASWSENWNIFEGKFEGIRLDWLREKKNVALEFSKKEIYSVKAQPGDEKAINSLGI